MEIESLNGKDEIKLKNGLLTTNGTNIDLNEFTDTALNRLVDELVFFIVSEKNTV